MAAVLALATVTMALPGALGAESDPRQENRAFILENNPEVDLDELVDVYHDGVREQVLAREALDLALDRAGDVDLRELTERASHDGTDSVFGDVWVIGLGNVECGATTTVAENPIGSFPLDEGLHIYEGEIGYNSRSSADTWVASSWTLKDQISGNGAVHYGGNSDYFCIEGTMGLLFPFIDGYASAREATGLPHPL